MTSALLAAAVAVAQPAHSEPALRVTAPTCVGLGAGEVQRLVELELESVTQEIREGPPLRVELDCKGDRLRITVVDPVTDKVLERELPAPEDEPGRERVVALAIAELFAASWLELLIIERSESDKDQRPVKSTPGTKSEAVRAAKRMAQDKTVARGRAELAAGAGVRGRALEAAPFAALHVDGEVRGWITPTVGIVGRVGFDFGQANRAQGQVRGTAVTGGGGVAWRYRARPAVGVGGYAILAGGWARVSGVAGNESVRAASNQGGTGEVAVGAGPRVFSRRFRMDIDAEVGAMLRSPEGTVQREESVSMGGFWVGLTLRIGADVSPRPVP